jgi:hypothetical protein
MLVPWKSNIAPAWRLKIVDEAGAPIRRLCISENWVDPTFKFFELEEDFWTDDDGYVNFPERNTWRNGLMVLATPFFDWALRNKKDYDAVAFGWGRYQGGTAQYNRGAPLPVELVMREKPVPHK